MSFEQHDFGRDERHLLARPWLRFFWMASAYISLALGLIGVVLPGLPTVPFILLASFCAARGSRRLHNWLHSHRHFGPMLVEWETHGAISRRAKWLASIMMVLCSALMWLSPSPFWAWAIGSSIMLVVGIWLWFRPEPQLPDNTPPDAVEKPCPQHPES